LISRKRKIDIAAKKNQYRGKEKINIAAKKKPISRQRKINIAAKKISAVAESSYRTLEHH
jgi:hypothetical protein